MKSARALSAPPAMLHLGVMLNAAAAAVAAFTAVTVAAVITGTTAATIASSYPNKTLI